MEEKIRTIEVLAWLNEVSKKLEQAESSLDRATDLIWNAVASHLTDEELIKLGSITPDDLGGFKDQA